MASSLKQVRDLARARLRNQRLAGVPAESPTEVVRWLGAVQAQERSIARWSVGQRCAAAVERDVDRALAEGAIVRTHVLRPTWHFVAAEDLRWIVALTAPRVHALNAHYYRFHGVDDRLVARSRSILERALRDGALTRPELAARLAAGRIAADDLRLGYILMRAELDLVICSGPPRGKQHSYALVDARVPPSRPRDRDEALGELATRYFRSHGPATLRDFSWWSSLTAGDARRARETAGLERLSVRERDYWMVEAGDAPGPARGPAAHLLQGYDEYVVAYSDTKEVFCGPPLPGTSGGGPAKTFLHAVLMEGRVIGHWRAVARARSVTVEMQLAIRPNEPQTRALRAAVERYGRFLGKPAELGAPAAP